MSSNGRSNIRTGIAVARGCAAGPVFIYRGRDRLVFSEYAIDDEAVDDELIRLKRARNEVKRDISGLAAALRQRSGDGNADVFECHAMLVDDPVLADEIEKTIADERLNAEAAVHRAFVRARERFGRMNDDYFRERARDIEDVERRLLSALTGSTDDQALAIKVPSIIVANDLTPSETIRLPREMVLGFALDGGSATNHVALLARALGIPAVAGLGDVVQCVRPGGMMLLDGTEGSVMIDPDENAIGEFRRRDSIRKRMISNAVPGDGASGLKDGGGPRIQVNMHPGMPVDSIGRTGACGIGLYRSEYLWLNRNAEPTEDEQFAAYREAVELAKELAKDALAVIRMLDIGGDKLVRGVSEPEDNPFLGNRSIRYLLSHREIMHTQLRAILRASAYGRTGIMYPMVSCVEELEECAKELSRAKSSLDRDGVAYSNDVRVGVMIEVPSAALNAETFASMVDFLSIGTNDLVQYTMAADRGNKAVLSLYQPMNPAIVRLVRMTIEAARKCGIEVGVCGESAADPVMGIYWAALGVDTLSMSADYIPIIGCILSRLTRSDLGEYAAIPDSLGPRAGADERVAACRRWLAARIPDFESILRR